LLSQTLTGMQLVRLICWCFLEAFATQLADLQWLTRFRFILRSSALSKWRRMHFMVHQRRFSRTRRVRMKRRKSMNNGSTNRTTTLDLARTTMAKIWLCCESTKSTRWSTSMQSCTATQPKQRSASSRSTTAMNWSWQISNLTFRLLTTTSNSLKHWRKKLTKSHLVTLLMRPKCPARWITRLSNWLGTKTTQRERPDFQTITKHCWSRKKKTTIAQKKCAHIRG